MVIAGRSHFTSNNPTVAMNNGLIEMRLFDKDQGHTRMLNDIR